MTHLTPNTRVLFNCKYGRVENIVPCGFSDRMIHIRLDGGMLVHQLESHMTITIERRPWPHLACSDGVDVRETPPCEVQP